MVGLFTPVNAVAVVRMPKVEGFRLTYTSQPLFRVSVGQQLGSNHAEALSPRGLLSLWILSSS